MEHVLQRWQPPPIETREILCYDKPACEKNKRICGPFVRQASAWEPRKKMERKSLQDGRPVAENLQSTVCLFAHHRPSSRPMCIVAAIYRGPYLDLVAAERNRADGRRQHSDGTSPRAACRVLQGSVGRVAVTDRFAMHTVGSHVRKSFFASLKVSENDKICPTTSTRTVA